MDMKKTFALLLCALLASLCVAPTAAAVPYGTATAGTAVVDGQIEAAWDVAEAYPVALLKDGTDEGITAQWKALWDDTNLYVLVEVFGDTDHFTGTSNSWGDGMEIYLDVLNNDPTDFTSDDTVCELGWTKDDATNVTLTGTDGAKENLVGTYAVACTELDDGYIYEFSMDLNGFCDAFVMQAGAVLGLEIQVNSKNAEGDNRTSALGWADGNNTAWQDPSIFGDLELIPAPVVETEAETTAETVVTTAPQTMDAGVIAAVAAMVSAAGFTLTRKNKR